MGPSPKIVPLLFSVHSPALSAKRTNSGFWAVAQSVGRSEKSIRIKDDDDEGDLSYNIICVKVHIAADDDDVTVIARVG